jgi:hypothetical protein
LVKIWNGKDENSEISQLKTYLSNFLELNACMYFNNKMKIAIDSRRQGGGRGGGRGGGGRGGGGGDSGRFRKPRQHTRNSDAFRSANPKPKPLSVKPWSGSWKELLQT